MTPVHDFDELTLRARALEPDAATVMAAVDAAATAPRRRFLRSRIALAAVAIAIIAPATAVAVTQFLSPAEVAAGLPRAQVWLQGTQPSCTTVTDGLEYECTLAVAPTNGPADWDGTIEKTVDRDGYVTGACVSANGKGTEWRCYVGQAAVDRNLVLTKEQFIEKYGPIETGPGRAIPVYLGSHAGQTAG